MVTPVSLPALVSTTNINDCVAIVLTDEAFRGENPSIHIEKGTKNLAHIAPKHLISLEK